MKKSLLNILIIDDEKEYLDVLNLILSKENYYIELESNPKKALVKSLDAKFDLIITDLVMPNISGLEILEKVKDANPHTEVIISTGYGSINNAVEAIKKEHFLISLKVMIQRSLYLK